MIRKHYLNAVVMMIVLLNFSMVFSANIDVARIPGKPAIVMGLKIEGDIEKGDAARFIAALKTLGPGYGTVYLYSRGGDVREAMEIGATVRRMRLSTEAPVKFSGYPPICTPVEANVETNCQCSSSCFLIYAGGVSRQGNLIGLHRPYLPRSTMANLSDVVFEDFQTSVELLRSLRSLRWVRHG